MLVQTQLEEQVLHFIQIGQQLTVNLTQHQQHITIEFFGEHIQAMRLESRVNLQNYSFMLRR